MKLYSLPIFALIWAILMYVLTFMIDDTFLCTYNLIKKNPNVKHDDPEFQKQLQQKCFKKMYLRYFYFILLFIGLLLCILLVFNLLRKITSSGITSIFIIIMIFITVLINPPKGDLFATIANEIATYAIYGFIIFVLLSIGKSSPAIWLEKYPVSKEVLIGLVIVALGVYTVRNFQPKLDPELEALAKQVLEGAEGRGFEPTAKLII